MRREQSFFLGIADDYDVRHLRCCPRAKVGREVKNSDSCHFGSDSTHSWSCQPHMQASDWVLSCSKSWRNLVKTLPFTC